MQEETNKDPNAGQGGSYTLQENGERQLDHRTKPADESEPATSEKPAKPGKPAAK